MKLHSIKHHPIQKQCPFLVLEAGVNHEGSLSKAFEMIDAAAESGAPMIKFQSYKADRLAQRSSPAYWDTRKETCRSQFELFQRYDALDIKDYEAMAERCRQKGILFCTTAFDGTFLKALGPLMPVLKIASADITNVPLMRQVGEQGRPVLLSTGASSVAEIDFAVRTLESAGAPEVVILHCILEYPTRPHHANLRSISYLAGVFPDYTIGWSDHLPFQFGGQSLITAWQLGADVIEKHFSLDKTKPGNDHYHAMDPGDVRDFYQQCRYTADLLGDFRKEVFPWERQSEKQARRSLVATRDLRAGEVINAEMLIPKRPGNGISPKYFDMIMGRTLQRNVKLDAPVLWEDFLGDRETFLRDVDVAEWTQEPSMSFAALSGQQS
jgi:N-acetylneuraminate synthase